MQTPNLNSSGVVMLVIAFLSYLSFSRCKKSPDRSLRSLAWIKPSWLIFRPFVLACLLSLQMQVQIDAQGYVGESTLPAGIPLLNDNMPPGMIGSIQLQRNGSLQNCYQPIEIRGLDGMHFALVNQGVFDDDRPQPLRAAVLVGPVYRFKATGIPGEPGLELFPTLEVIDRTYPPAEREHRFPIIVEIDQVDIEAAMRGDLVTRVIYLEDSTNAPPVNYENGPQRVFDISLGDDTLRTADYYGRPVAILRIGSRIPDVVEGPDAYHFLFGSPPWVPIKDAPKGKTLSDVSLQSESRGLPPIVSPSASMVSPPALP